MREYIKRQIETEEEYEETQLQNWLVDSHYWEEWKGTMHCKWCGRVTTTVLEGDEKKWLKERALKNY